MQDQIAAYAPYVIAAVIGFAVNAIAAALAAMGRRARGLPRKSATFVDVVGLVGVMVVLLVGLAWFSGESLNILAKPEWAGLLVGMALHQTLLAALSRRRTNTSV